MKQMKPPISQSVGLRVNDFINWYISEHNSIFKVYNFSKNTETTISSLYKIMRNNTIAAVGEKIKWSSNMTTT